MKNKQVPSTVVKEYKKTKWISFNMEDAEQGVFLENENGLSRMENYARRGTNIVDFTVPASLAAGSYSISIVTKPGNKYFTANIDSEITVA